MFMKIFTKIKMCLILVIIQKIQFCYLFEKKWSVKRKMKSKGKKISEAVGLKSKMYSFIVVDGG